MVNQNVAQRQYSYIVYLSLIVFRANMIAVVWGVGIIISTFVRKALFSSESTPPDVGDTILIKYVYRQVISVSISHCSVGQ